MINASARGVRVAGAIWAAFVLGMAVFMVYAYSWWDGMLLAAPIAVFLSIRPWFMGIAVDGDTILVRGWYRHQRILSADIVAIDLDKCMSLLVGFQTGFIPFVGKVRMIEIQIMKDGKQRFRSLPGTLGRYNTVLKVARELRGHLGLPI